MGRGEGTWSKAERWGECNLWESFKSTIIVLRKCNQLRLDGDEFYSFYVIIFAIAVCTKLKFWS